MKSGRNSTKETSNSKVSDDGPGTSKDSHGNNEEFKKVQIGKHYMIHRYEDELESGEVVQTRYNEELDVTEYYVHYDHLDRRLDGWVTCSRIATALSEGSSEESDLDDSDDDDTGQIKRKRLKLDCKDEDESGSAVKSFDDVEKEHEELTRVKYIDSIQFGVYEIGTWYFSPFPDEYGNQPKLYICEYCLKYMKLEKSYRYHLGECTRRQPPGKEIYHKGTLSIFETDPTDHRLYCQNLCLMAKLFIDHKTVHFDVEQFYFYILCDVDKHGSHIVGYFSKEKDSPDGNNVACILTLPPFQRQGYGKLLIAFSYELCKLEGTVGSPEKPLSDLGRISYSSYWSWVLLEILRDFRGVITLKKLSEMTSITTTDIAFTLRSMNMAKYWDGENAICVTPQFVEQHILSSKFKRPKLTVDTSAICWEPHPVFNYKLLICPAEYERRRKAALAAAKEKLDNSNGDDNEDGEADDEEEDDNESFADKSNGNKKYYQPYSDEQSENESDDENNEDGNYTDEYRNAENYSNNSSTYDEEENDGGREDGNYRTENYSDESSSDRRNVSSEEEESSYENDFDDQSEEQNQRNDATQESEEEEEDQQSSEEYEDVNDESYFENSEDERKPSSSRRASGHDHSNTRR